MDRYSIILGKKPPPPLVIPESDRIYYLGATINSGQWAAAICREDINATIEIVDTTTMKKYSNANEMAQNLNALNKKYPIRAGLIDSLIISSEPLNFKLSCSPLRNKIAEFYKFWMNIPGVSKFGPSGGYVDPMENAVKLSFWALHETLTKNIPNLYTDKKSFNKHIKELHRLRGFNAPIIDDEIEFPEEGVDVTFRNRLEEIRNSLQDVERRIESI